MGHNFKFSTFKLGSISTPTDVLYCTKCGKITKTKKNG